MRSTKTAESGFTLVEVVVVVALVAIAGLASVAAVAAIGRNGEPQTNRNLALMVARNALERARAAAAYLPLAATPAASSRVAAFARAGDASYVLQLGATSFSAQVAVPAVTCGSGSVRQIALSGTAVVTPPAAGATGTTIAVNVTYPPSACAPSATRSVSLSETLPPPLLAPGTQVYAPLSGEPAEQ
ncbi:MAG: prepilin-type N-terminal cleavage/methylation domain-containing protein [Candidatus Velthaea sp.]|jgi:prepilin-type N-terminal cleavage/methylation domain-containing protein